MPQTSYDSKMSSEKIKLKITEIKAKKKVSDQEIAPNQLQSA